jgi:hypothetical protein
MSHQLLLGIALGLIAALVFPREAGGQQASSATLSGTVVDESGAVIPQATVWIADGSRAFERTAHTDQGGRFAFIALPPAVYELKVEREGFSTAALNDLRLQVGDERTVIVKLLVGAVADSVTVEAPARRTSPSIATTIEAEFVERQPLNGRGFQALIELSPGTVIAPTNVTTGGTFSVNGQRTGSNGFYVDGVSANFGAAASFTPYQTAGGGLPSLSAQGGTNTLASVDAVQEFTIETSTYAPEFGRQAGGQISIVTRSGTNAFHGSVFDYWRDAAFDAKDYFAKRNDLPKPELSQHNFGVTVGGPVQPDRAFFFITYEGLRLDQPVTSMPFLVPSVAAREAATGQARDILNAYPLPTSDDSTDPLSGTFVGAFTNPSRLDAFSARLDLRPAPPWAFFTRYNRAPSSIEERAYFATPNTISFREYLTETLTTGATWTRGRVTNDFRVNWSRARASDRYEIDDFGGAIVPTPATLLPPYGDPDRDLGLAYIGSDSGIYLGRNSTNLQRQFQIVDIVSLATGSHLLKGGVDFRRLTPRTGTTDQWSGGFFFDTTADVINEIVPFYYSSISAFALEPVYQNLSLFGQDTWRFRRASLTYGLRWDISPAPGEAQDKLPLTVMELDSAAGPELAPPNTKFFETSWGNVAPRVGVAYDLFPERGTLLRGGFGVFYDLPYTFTGTALQAGAYPYGNVILAGPIPLTDPLVDAVVPLPEAAPPYGDLTAYEAGYGTPFTRQWNVGVEQALRRATVAVSYLGAAGRRLGRVESVRNVYVDFPRIDIVRDAARSDYKALQAQVRYRSSSLHFTASYTLAESLDTVSNESLINFQAPLASYDPEQDRGPSDFDVRHAFAAAVSYIIPGGVLRGIGIDAFFRARSALPVNVLTDSDPVGYGFFSVTRPDRVPGEPLYLDDETAPGGRRFNPAAFVVPAAGQGNLPRNALRGFAAWQTDLSVSRDFTIRSPFRVQLRLDVFNVFNRANLGNPSGNMASVNFGVATQMLNQTLGGVNPVYQIGGPRSLQIAARVRF